MTETISSRNNPKIKRIIKLLSSSKQRREDGLFVVEGLRLCVDAVLSGYVPYEVYYTEAAYAKSKNDIGKIINKCDNVYLSEQGIFDKISDTATPQGIMCILRMREERPEIKPDGKYVGLCSVADPANLGAVSRTAEALGIDGMIVSGGCDVYNPKALRASMGALMRMNVISANTDEMFAMFRECGIKTYASTPRSTAKKLSDCRFDCGSAVLIGNEANGLNDYEIENSDFLVTIPMAGRSESLNAAAAAAILMYEMTR